MGRQAKALLVVGMLFGILVFAAGGKASQSHVLAGPIVVGGTPQSLAVDQGSGDLYVLDPSQATISRYDATGTPVAFSALNGSNAINGSDAGSDKDQTPSNGFAFDTSSQVAVDSSGGATDGNIYVADSAHAVIDVFAETGEYIGQLSGAGTNSAEPTQTWAEAFAYPCGVTTDPAGKLYVAVAFGPPLGNAQIERYAPATSPVSDSDLDSQITEAPSGSCGIAANSSGDLYATTNVFGSPGVLTEYAASDFGSAAPAGTILDPSVTAVALDPSNGDVYADNGNRATHYDSSATQIASFAQGELSESHGIAVDASGGGADGNVYASDAPAGLVNVFGPLATVPASTTGSADGVTSSSATLHGQVDPDGIEVSDCSFEYGTDTSYGQSANCAQTVGSGSGAVDVSAAISDLSYATEYHFRLRAANANGPGAPGEDQTFTTEQIPPILGDTFATEIASTTATLKSTVDPAGQATAYRFEYTTKADFEANEWANALKAPKADQAIGSGKGALAVSQALSELSADTDYRFRVLATNSIGTSESPVKGFHTFAVPGDFTLPDDRGYEMVSPLDKNGGDISGDPSKVRAATDGSAVSYSSLSGFADEIGSGNVFQYMSVRTSQGWRTHSIQPPQEPQDAKIAPSGFPHYPGDFSADLQSGVIKAISPLGSDPFVEAAVNLYVRDDLRDPGFGDWRLVTASEVPLPAPSVLRLFPNQPTLADTSDDFHHIIFESRLNLTTQATGDDLIKLYEWDDGVVRLAGILPNGDPATCPPPAPANTACSSAGAGATAPRVTYTDTTMSRDGSRVYFSSPVHPADGSATSETQLYLRLNGTETTQVSASERTVPDPPEAARFVMASNDGMQVFFITSARLIDEDNDSGSDLYRYDASLPDSDPHNLTRVARGVQSGNGGIIGMSADASYVYVLADPQGLPGEPSYPTERLGIYVFHGGSLHFIGSVYPDFPRIVTNLNWGLHEREARVSSDGRVLAFLTRLGAGLTGYDHGQSCGDGVGCLEAYVYDAEANGGAGELTCASCRRDGTPPSFDSLLSSREFGLADAGLNTPHQTKALTRDGKHLFFMTSERLLPEDRNGSVLDIYEYDTEDAELHLLTQGSENSYLQEVSDSGDDVFFVTRNRLVGADTDSAYDMYDARVGGGFPEPPPAPVCEGDSCLNPPSPPDDPTPGTAAVSGPGDPRPVRARKPCAKRKGKARKRCFSRHQHKRANQNRRPAR